MPFTRRSATWRKNSTSDKWITQVVKYLFYVLHVTNSAFITMFLSVYISNTGNR